MGTAKPPFGIGPLLHTVARLRAETGEREALKRVHALHDPVTVAAALSRLLGRELTPQERVGIVPTVPCPLCPPDAPTPEHATLSDVEAAIARHNAEIVGPTTRRRSARTASRPETKFNSSGVPALRALWRGTT